MKAILFDFDGVVIKSMEDHFQGWRKALAEYGIDMNPEELYVLEGQGVEEVASQLVRKFNIPAEERKTIIQKKRFYFDQVKKVELYPNDRERVMLALQEYGIDTYFHAIITSDDVLHTKPSPEPYINASEFLGIEPAHCIVVENAPLGILSAKAAGMKCIAVTTTLPPAFLKKADVVADNFQEVLEALRKLY